VAGLFESLEKVLRANPRKNYCASCLADAVGLGSSEDRTPVARLMRGAYTTVTDRVVESGTCAQCNRTGMIVRYRG
jgi:hypothetical protein